MATASTFPHDLRRFGPEREDSTVFSLSEARSYCVKLAASHYENFSVVTRLTPKRLRGPFAAVYAFCRWSDDLGDEVGDPELSKRLLGWWRDELVGVYRGRASSHPVLIALSETIDEFSIPIDPFLDLISAFEQDQTVTSYETRDRLLDYCKRSADPVGRLVLHLGAVFNEENAALSDFTCTGLQLANFWQDVARDAAIGRVYLPKVDRDRFGYSDLDLQVLRCNSEFRNLMEYEVEFARSLLEAGRPLIAKLPRDLAPSIDLFNRGGLAILKRIEKADYDVLKKRPRLTKLDKAALIGRALLFRPSRRVGSPPS